MDISPRLPPFNENVAKRYIDAAVQTSGLPEFLGIRTTFVEPGRMRVQIPVDPKLVTRIGNMHGGVLSALCDHVLGSVCYLHMLDGYWAATTEFKLNLLAPVSSGTVTAEATIIAMTRTTAVVRIDVTNDGRPCCAAQGTVLILPPRQPKPTG